MKKNKLIAVAILLATQTIFAQKANTNEQDVWLTKKLQQVKQSDNGVQIKQVAKKYVDDAVKNLGGKATVDFGETQKLKFAPTSGSLKQGGVIIGSGGDSLVSTSSADKNGPIVVQPPVIPKTSVTVVGRWGKSQNNLMICAASLKVDSQGQLVKFGGRESLLNSCAHLNKPIRLGAGYYYLAMGHQQRGSDVEFRKSGVFVSVSEGENKIVPLREITVPKYTSNETKILYTVKNQFDSQQELLKSANLIFSLCPAPQPGNQLACRTLQNQNTWITVSKKFSEILTESESPADLLSKCLQSNSFKEGCSLIFTYVILADTVNVDAQDGDFVSVFPGTYQIDWLIDGQIETTRDIVVE